MKAVNVFNSEAAQAMSRAFDEICWSYMFARINSAN
jgi:hypothetical protein